MVEKGEADDKIIAVLLGDPTFGDMTDVAQLPRAVIDRLRHYFLTYKVIPGETNSVITVDPVYSAMVARAVLRAAPQVDDCTFRMLTVEEIRAGMAFTPGYRFAPASKRAKVRMLGNAVTPPAARDLVAAVAEAITGEPIELAA